MLRTLFGLRWGAMIVCRRGDEVPLPEKGISAGAYVGGVTSSESRAGRSPCLPARLSKTTHACCLVLRAGSSNITPMWFRGILAGSVTSPSSEIHVSPRDGILRRPPPRSRAKNARYTPRASILFHQHLDSPQVWSIARTAMTGKGKAPLGLWGE